ncbi:MAG TPA: hypothetical protein VEB22_11495 [Phycisphaerales bacterium]|nr:hypothetical protein [Phycisphaerales bacterium]
MHRSSTVAALTTAAHTAGVVGRSATEPGTLRLASALAGVDLSPAFTPAQARATLARMTESRLMLAALREQVIGTMDRVPDRFDPMSEARGKVWRALDRVRKALDTYADEVARDAAEHFRFTA